ncbi:hypothetical protein RF55_9826 [Lasius niger]|uniref:Uncharacterized protein n=1 Tax=Lasius niger TaxID=67767 RepID=A0A0J7KJ17_LASNI|nr:hypothetical protein RF55_9826 [Lasius niger]
MESVLDPNTGHKVILSSEDNILSSDTLSSVKLWTLRPNAKRRIVAVRLDISNVFLLLYVASQSKSICTSHTGGWCPLDALLRLPLVPDASTNFLIRLLRLRVHRR